MSYCYNREFNKIYSQRVNQLMKEKGLTVKQLSELANLSTSTIDKIIKGEIKTIGYKAILHLSIAFEVCILYLRGLTNNRNLKIHKK